MKTLLNFNKPSMRNDLHVQFHTQIRNLIQPQLAELGLTTAFYDAYTKSIYEEQDFVNRASGSELTRKLAALDAERDRFFRYIFNSISNLQNSKEEADAEHYAILREYILTKYPLSIARMGNKEESACLRGLCNDMREDKLRPIVEAVGLMPYVERLEQSNDDYDATFLLRNEEQVNLGNRLMLRLRESNDRFFDQLTAITVGQANALDTTTPTYAPSGRFIDLLNGLITTFRSRVRSYYSGSTATPAAESATESGTEPVAEATPASPDLPASPTKSEG